MSNTSNIDWSSWPPEAKAELRWRLSARANQLQPPGDWNVWLLLAGRGFGKTRTGAEWCRKLATENRGIIIAVIAPTFADARDTCVEGPAGLLSVIPKPLVEKWNRSMGELQLVNGSRFKLFSAEEPERLRGPQHHFAWCDELAAWPQPETWDQLMFGLRLGSHPRVVATTTPKPTKLVRELVGRKDVFVTKGNTFDNAENLAPAALEQLRQRYEGTRLGRQELYAEILEDVEGALWNREMLDDNRVSEAPDLVRIVVAVDPAGGGTAETGIVVAGVGRDGHGYVLADVSVRGTPNEWARRVADAFHSFEADRVVAEKNFGGDMVEATLRMADRNLPVKLLTASRAKIPRAEPVAALYEQGRVHHVGVFDKLEDQMCTWEPDSGQASPDRMDALVWAISELMVSGRYVNKLAMPVSLPKQTVWRIETQHGNESGLLDVG